MAPSCGQGGTRGAGELRIHVRGFRARRRRASRSGRIGPKTMIAQAIDLSAGVQRHSGGQAQCPKHSFTVPASPSATLCSMVKTCGRIVKRSLPFFFVLVLLRSGLLFFHVVADDRSRGAECSCRPLPAVLAAMAMRAHGHTFSYLCVRPRLFAGPLIAPETPFMRSEIYSSFSGGRMTASMTWITNHSRTRYPSSRCLRCRLGPYRPRP